MMQYIVLLTDVLVIFMESNALRSFCIAFSHLGRACLLVFNIKKYSEINTSA